jgi:hypothetical protein
MTGDVVETVARAIHLAEKGRPADELFWTTPATGSELYRRQAAAAIAAMPQHWRGVGKLIEEAGEVFQLIGKAIAFPVGPHPDGLGPIRDRLPAELTDLSAALLYFLEENKLVIDPEREDDKLAKFRRWGLPGVHDMQARAYSTPEVKP